MGKRHPTVAVCGAHSPDDCRPLNEVAGIGRKRAFSKRWSKQSFEEPYE